jgi:hypothetical protein
MHSFYKSHYYLINRHMFSQKRIPSSSKTYFMRVAKYVNLAYYLNILNQTKSLHIKPIFCQTTMPKKIVYHSVYINRAISEKEWGDHPSFRSLKGFDIPFCYYDYIDAWFKFFLYQTSNIDHSWFINFDQENSGGIFPLWFVKWWSHFGQIPKILSL